MSRLELENTHTPIKAEQSLNLLFKKIKII